MCRKLSCLISLGLVLCVAEGVANADLVAYWPFDEGTGSVAQDAVGNHDGQFTGSPTWILPGQMGAGALEVNGGNYVNCGNVSTAADITIAFWMKADNAHQRPIAASSGDYATDPGWMLMLRAEGFLWFRIHGSDSGGWAGGDLHIDEALYEADTWVHMVITFDSVTRDINGYINGELRGTATAADGRTIANTTQDLRFGNTGTGEDYNGALDEVAIWDHALTPEEVLDVYTLGPLALDPRKAGKPNPEDEATDVPRDVVLSWTPGEFAAPTNGHKVYFGESFDDVNDATGGIAQTPASYAPEQPLDFGKIYYWRVDEIDNANTVYPGDVWSFTVEPYAYAIENIVATASSSDSGTTGPENTVNRSGLDANDLHSTVKTDMWLSGSEPLGASIQYEFDKVYKVHEMWVWNFNVEFESALGFGFKDVTIEYSADGSDWTALDGVPGFAQAPGTPDYAHNTPVDFGGVSAKYVKITANSNWGSLTQYGLSEVRFFYMPVWAREPSPDDEATDVGPDVVLNWRAGRQAATHDVYLSSNRKDVVDGTASVGSVSEASYDAGTLDLGETYYWKINEVNEAEVPTSWEGDIWNFATPEYLVVDDFEDYDTADNQIWFVWKDGIGYSDPAYPPSYPGNNTGSAVGDENTSNYMEQTIFYGGRCSMPLAYDNSGAGGKLRYSETFREWSVPQNWTANGVKALVVPFYGDPANTPAPLYVAVEDSMGNIKDVAYNNGDPDAVLVDGWQEFQIPLTDFTGVSLSSVTKLYFGVGNRNFPQVGGTGTLYIDDIGLYPSRCIPDIAKPAGDLNNDCKVDYLDIELMAENWLAVVPDPITVPNGDFELMYKPGTAITGVVSDGGWSQGVGPDCPIDNGEYIFSDETTGTVADIPGWIGYDKEGWIALDGTYGRDQTTGNLQGSVARQGNYTPDGLHCYLSNGGGWGNAAGGLIVSDASLGNIEDGIYTLSMVANGGATPVVLELLAGGVALTPASSVDPVLTGDWQEFSRTYDSASLAGFVGQPLTIVLGVGRDAAGAQTQFDDVTLFHSSEPLPTEILRLADPRVDLNDDKKVDFKDFAVLADSWLEEQLWPEW